MSGSPTLLFIALLAVSGVVMVGSAFAQSIPKPSVPEFTGKFVNASYTVTAINSYTGFDEIELIGNNSIEITVSNQPFDYSNYQIYYDIRVKPHFADDWIEVYPVRNRTSLYNEDGTFSYAPYINDDSMPQSESSFTVVTFSVVPTELYLGSGYDVERYYSGAGGQEGEYFAFLSAIPYDGQVDFQVEALVGHDAEVYVNDHPLAPYPIGHYEQAIAFDMTSGWSSTQTLTISTSAPSPSPPSLTLTPEQTTGAANENFQKLQLGAIIGAVIAFVLMSIGLLIYFKKRRKDGNI